MSQEAADIKERSSKERSKIVKEYKKEFKTASEERRREIGRKMWEGFELKFYTKNQVKSVFGAKLEKDIPFQYTRPELLEEEIGDPAFGPKVVAEPESEESGESEPEAPKKKITLKTMIKKLGASAGNLAKKVLAPQTPNVNVPLNQAVTDMSKNEVQRQKDYVDKVQEQLKTGEPVMVAPDKAVVRENTDIINSGAQLNTPENVLAELDTEQIGNIVRGLQSDNPLVSEETLELLPVYETETIDDEMVEEELLPVYETEPIDEMNEAVASDEQVGEQVLSDEKLMSGAEMQTNKEIPAVYHVPSVTLFLGNPPQWDPELYKNIMNLELSKEQIAKMMASVIQEYGQKIFVYAAKTQSKEELNELVQLQFCVMRNLHRGARAKTAEIPISSLVEFSNKLSMPKESVTMNRASAPAVQNSSVRPTQGQSFNPRTGKNGAGMQGQPIRISTASAIEKIADVYNYGEFNPSGKLRVNAPVSRDTLITHPSINGPNSGVDPANQDAKGLDGFKLKKAKNCKTMSM